MAQYFTERLEKVFHMIFTSYNQEMAEEGLRQLRYDYLSGKRN